MNKYLVKKMSAFTGKKYQISEKEYLKMLEEGFEDGVDVIKVSENNCGDYSCYYYPYKTIDSWDNDDISNYFQLRQIEVLEQQNENIRIIKSIMVFFCVLTVISLIAAIIIGVKIGDFMSSLRYFY